MFSRGAMCGEQTADPDLVAQARDGSELAFAALYNRHVRAARSAVAGVVRGQSAQDDLLQDVFVHAFDRLATLRDPALFRPWLVRSARNLALDHVRREARRPELVELDSRVGSTDAAPDEIAELHDLAERLARGTAKLTRRDAVALSLTVQFGLDAAEIALALGVTPNNAKVIVHRARRRLREAADL